MITVISPDNANKINKDVSFVLKINRVHAASMHTLQTAYLKNRDELFLDLVNEMSHEDVPHQP